MKPTVPETGRVIELKGSDALVVIEGGKSCKGCGAARIGLCRAGGHTMLLTVRNSAAAKPGDKVIIGMDGKTRRRGYRLAYIIPLLAFITGAVAGDILGMRYSAPLLAVFCAFLFFGLAAAIGLARLRKLDRSYTMEIKRIVSDGEFNEFFETEEERLYLKYTAHC